MQFIRHAVELVKDHLRHPREELDDGDARIADVMVGPLGAVTWDKALCLIDDILEVAQVHPAFGHLHGHG